MNVLLHVSASFTQSDVLQVTSEIYSFKWTSMSKLAIWDQN